MSTQGARETPRRGHRRRKNVLNLDLNNAPLGEGRDQVGTSNQDASVPVPPPTIDLDAIEDEVVESSASAFAEAKRKARNNARTEVVIVDLDDRTRIAQSFRNKRRRVPVNQRVPFNQTIINCELYMNVERYVMRENTTRPSGPVPPPPPPKEPTFSCPICMGPLVEEMSTKCGHIFCKACIRAAINVQPKCPTCRKKVTPKELIRVFLPATG